MAHDDFTRASRRAMRRAGSFAARRPGWLVLLSTGVLVAIAIAGQVRAATYKWVDDKGVTHYSDKLPASEVNRGSTVLDKQANPIRKVDPAPTPDQVRARQAEVERAQALAREQEIQGRRDRALLASYTAENEIELARRRALATIDAQIQSAQAFTAELARRRDALLAKKAAAGDKGLPPADARELEGTEGELAKQQALIAQKQKEREMATARYDADKMRWRELRKAADANGAAATAPASPSPAPGSAAAPLRK